MLKLLLKKQLLEIFRSYFYDAKKNKARSKISTAMYFVLFALLIVGLLGGIFTFLAAKLCTPLVSAGLDWLYFALMGFLTVLLHMSLLQMAVLHMDASATSIIYSGNPVFAVAAAHVILHEPLRKNHLLAIALEVVGILFILNPAHLEISLRGFLEIITATLLFALYGTFCKLRVSRLGGIVIADFNILLGGLEMLAVLLLGKIPAVAAAMRAVGLDLFAEVPFFTGFTLKSTLLLCYAGVFCAGIGFVLTAKITEYTSATEASFIYLIKPILATILAAVVYQEFISVNRIVGIGFFLAASLCVSVPVLRAMRREKMKEKST